MSGRTSLFDLDYKEWQKAVLQLKALARKEPEKVLKSEARLFVKDVALATPPFVGRNPFRESWAEQRRAGHAAIDADINATFQPLSKLDVVIKPTSPAIKKQIAKLLRTKDAAGLEKLLKSAGIVKDQALRVFKTLPKDLYENLRGRTGRRLRRNKQKPWFVIDERSIEREKRERKKDVGMGKSGWKRAAAALKLALPQWITSKNGGGIFKDDTGNKDFQSITVGNTVRHVQRAGGQERVMQRALTNRARSAKTRLEQALKKMERHNGR